MRLLRYIRAICLAWLLTGVFLLTSVSAHAASIYGRDSYGNCTYGTCTQHTVQQTPSGLKVAINLTDGQSIPTTGYTIKITPLNGAGSSFASADIYIDGQKVATITPGDDGAANWYWDVTAHPGKTVDIKVLDSSGAVTSFHFNVSVAPAVVTQGTKQSGGGNITQRKQFIIAQLLSDTAESAKQTIKKLPAPVIYTFPYLLFALLLLEIIILLLQTKREVREIDTNNRLAAHERQIASMKQTLLELVSHYLRTPLTILQGGAEGLTRDNVPAAIVAPLQTVVKQMHETIETLISTTTSVGNVVTTSSEPEPAQTQRTSQALGQVAIWLPVLLVGLSVAAFVFLANEVSRFTTNTVGMLTQAVTYVILILVLYQVVRRWHLHRHDTLAARKVLQDEQAVQSIRDTVITQTAAQLKNQVATLGALAGQLPSTAVNAKFVHRGYDQLNTITNKFVIASHLKGAASTDPFQQTSLHALYGKIEPGLQAAIANKKLSIVLPPTDPILLVRNAGLITLVTKTLLDNAIAYSNEAGTIEIGLDSSPDTDVLSVTDHGIGIAENKRAALFQPFYKAEGAEEFNREGMGFSLYLDKLIMIYLGGDIALTSNPNVATTVTLTLPKTT